MSWETRDATGEIAGEHSTHDSRPVRHFKYQPLVNIPQTTSSKFKVDESIPTNSLGLRQLGSHSAVNMATPARRRAVQVAPTRRSVVFVSSPLANVIRCFFWLDVFSDF